MMQKRTDDINKMDSVILKRLATKIKDDSHIQFKRGLVYIELGQYNTDADFANRINQSNISDEVKTSLKLNKSKH